MHSVQSIMHDEHRRVKHSSEQQLRSSGPQQSANDSGLGRSSARAILRAHRVRIAAVRLPGGHLHPLALPARAACQTRPRAARLQGQAHVHPLRVHARLLERCPFQQSPAGSQDASRIIPVTAEASTPQTQGNQHRHSSLQLRLLNSAVAWVALRSRSAQYLPVAVCFACEARHPQHDAQCLVKLLRDASKNSRQCYDEQAGVRTRPRPGSAASWHPAAPWAARRS